MDKFKIYSHGDISNFVNPREGETKIGEKVRYLNSLDDLHRSDAKFVVFGIPEDIGVRANFGIGGTKTAWSATLKALLNMQSNPFFDGQNLLVLGHLEIDEPSDKSLESLRYKVGVIDTLVCSIVERIVSVNKIPIIIGGGHNNALGAIWGTSKALKSKVNVVNIDAHTDMRKAEGRHSGNPFTYAIQNGYLDHYRVFGLQQNYLNAQFPELVRTNSKIRAFYFEDLLRSRQNILSNWSNFVADLPSPCGLEVDLDSIAHVLSSASSPSGFSLSEVRAMLLASEKAFQYLHICEGATELTDGRNDPTTGKTIAFLVVDFIKALRPHISQQPST
ncbi:MAG: arginase [Pedobacter sp.]|nr:MAG: arginase [Pedobacter sp.]